MITIATIASFIIVFCVGFAAGTIWAGKPRDDFEEPTELHPEAVPVRVKVLNVR